VTPCILVGRLRRFEGNCYPHPVRYSNNVTISIDVLNLKKDLGGGGSVKVEGNDE
jgi:hypothetical protein